MTFTLHAACGRLDPEPVARPPHCLHTDSDRTERGLCQNCGRFVGPVVEPRYGWKCLSCGEVLMTGSFLKIANDKGELAHDGGWHECGPVVGTVRL